MGSSPDSGLPVSSSAEVLALLSALQVEVVGLKAQNEALQETIVNLTHENALFKRRICGNKTERSGTTELQLTLGSLLDGDKQLQRQLDESVKKTLNAASGEANDGEGPVPKKPKVPPKGRRDLTQSSLPRVPVDILDPSLEQSAKRIGFDESLQLMYRRGGFAVLVKRTAKYEVTGKDGTTILGVETPKTLFPRGLLHSSVAAHVIVQKFALGVPHHRLEQHLKNQACELDRSVMCRYVEEAGNALGATVVNAMWQQAKGAAVISTDATSGLVQPEPGGSPLRQACKKGHFFTAVVDCDYVLFAFTEKHSQDFVKKLFAGFNGYLQADASNVYDVLEQGPPQDAEEGVSLVGCWAHCRRYFFEAAICKYSVGLQGLMHIRAIYAADDALKKLPPDRRKGLRDEHVRPLMERFFEWAKVAKTLAEGRNLATRALGYALNQQHELLRVLKDPRLPLDNTRSERALRKIVVGRKNWMFYGSDTHAEAAAALFSLIATCRLHKVDVELYLDEVLRLLPYWPQHRFIELAPNRWAATRATLDPKQLDKPLCAFSIPSA